MVVYCFFFFYWISFFNSIQSFLRLNGFCFKPNELKPNRKWMEINWQLLWSIACFCFCVVFCLMIFCALQLPTMEGHTPKEGINWLAGCLNRLLNCQNIELLIKWMFSWHRWVHQHPNGGCIFAHETTTKTTTHFS